MGSLDDFHGIFIYFLTLINVLLDENRFYQIEDFLLSFFVINYQNIFIPSGFVTVDLLEN